MVGTPHPLGNSVEWKQNVKPSYKDGGSTQIFDEKKECIIILRRNISVILAFASLAVTDIGDSLPQWADYYSNESNYFAHEF